MTCTSTWGPVIHSSLKIHSSSCQPLTLTAFLEILIGTCSGALSYWFNYLYKQDRIHNGLLTVSAVRTISGRFLFNITVHEVSLDKSMFHTPWLRASLPTRQLTFEVLLDHVQTPGLSLIRLLRAMLPLLSENHYHVGSFSTLSLFWSIFVIWNPENFSFEIVESNYVLRMGEG